MTSAADSMRFRGDSFVAAAQPLVTKHQQELVMTRRHETQVVLSAPGELRFGPAQDLQIPRGGGALQVGRGGEHVTRSNQELRFAAHDAPRPAAPEGGGRSGGPARGGGAAAPSCCVGEEHSVAVFVAAGAVPPVEQELKDEWVVVEQWDT